MDLSNPLATVTPTLDAAVLQALSATTGVATGAHVHRMAGTGSADGVRRVLARLVDQGIVVADEHAHATLYRLNRDHVACDLIVAITRLRQTIVDKIRNSMEEWPAPPRHASLFGSFARADAGTDSDIDILIVSDEGNAEDVDRLREEVWLWTGNQAHILEVNTAELAELIRASDPLVESWRRDHVDLQGTRLLDVLRGLRADSRLGSRGIA
jgi:predicted nucleotidyltransferase